MIPGATHYSVIIAFCECISIRVWACQFMTVYSVCSYILTAVSLRAQRSVIVFVLLLVRCFNLVIYLTVSLTINLCAGRYICLYISLCVRSFLHLSIR